MDRLSARVVVLLVVLSGFLGGAVTSWLMTSSAFAQNRILQVEGIVFVDEEGKAQGGIDLTQADDRSVSLKLRNGEGRVVWESLSEGRMFVK